MKDVQAVSVIYHGRKVGTLSMGNRSNCQFEYDKDWLTDGFSISPLKLPLKAGLFTADYQPFNGNFGVWPSMSMPIIWMTMHVISALSAARAHGPWLQHTT